MTPIYVAAPGRFVPGWPANGRAINELSRLERNYVRDSDLIEKPAGGKPATAQTPKKEA